MPRLGQLARASAALFAPADPKRGIWASALGVRRGDGIERQSRRRPSAEETSTLRCAAPPRFEMRVILGAALDGLSLRPFRARTFSLGPTNRHSARRPIGPHSSRHLRPPALYFSCRDFPASACRKVTGQTKSFQRRSVPHEDGEPRCRIRQTRRGSRTAFAAGQCHGGPAGGASLGSRALRQSRRAPGPINAPSWGIPLPCAIRYSLSRRRAALECVIISVHRKDSPTLAHGRSPVRLQFPSAVM